MTASTLAIALACGAVMGFIISVLGAGGSLFIVPILVYGFGQSVRVATGTSLVVVFSAALVGAFGHARAGHVRGRILLAFGVASMAGAVIGARLHLLASERTVTIALALTLLAASLRMMIGRTPQSASSRAHALVRLLPLGLAVGVLTGFVGVGGGFVIVPVLVWGAGVALRDAIGTSLAVIAMSSITGSTAHILEGNVDPRLAAAAGLGAIAGALSGAPLTGKLPERPLRLGFGALVLGAAIYILVRPPG
jgi:uncharacterized protein